MTTSTPLANFPPELPEKINMLTFIHLQTDEDVALETKLSPLGEIADRDSQRHDLLSYYETIDRDLATLLLLDRDMFWSVALNDPSLGIYLDSFLLNIRSYSVKGSPFLIAPSSLSSSISSFLPSIKEKTFKLLARLSMRKEMDDMPELSVSQQGKILYDHLVIYPHALLDICTIYGSVDHERTSRIVIDIIKSNPAYVSDLLTISTTIVESLVLLDRQILSTLYPKFKKDVNPLVNSSVEDGETQPIRLPATYAPDMFSLLTALSDTLFSMHSLLTIVPDTLVPLAKTLVDYKILPTLARFADYTIPHIATHFHCGYATFRSNPIFASIYAYIVQISKICVTDGILKPCLLTPEFLVPNVTLSTLKSGRASGQDSHDHEAQDDTTLHSMETLVRSVTPADVKRILLGLQAFASPIKPPMLPGEVENPTLSKQIIYYFGDKHRIETGGSKLKDYDYDIEEKILIRQVGSGKSKNGQNSEDIYVDSSDTSLDNELISYTDFGSLLYYINKLFPVSKALSQLLDAANQVATALPSLKPDTLLMIKLHEKICRALQPANLEMLRTGLHATIENYKNVLSQIHAFGVHDIETSDPLFPDSLSSTKTSNVGSSTEPGVTSLVNVTGLTKDQKIDRFVEEISGFRSFFADYSTDFALAVLESFKFDLNASVNAMFENSLPVHLKKLSEAQRASFSLSGPELGPSSSSSLSSTVKTSGMSTEDAEFQRQLSNFVQKTGRVLKSETESLGTGMQLNKYENEKEKSRERAHLAAVAAAAAAMEAMYNDEYDDAFDGVRDFQTDLRVEDENYQKLMTSSTGPMSSPPTASTTGSQAALSKSKTKQPQNKNKKHGEDDGDDDDDDAQEEEYDYGPNKMRGGRVVGEKKPFKGNESMSIRDKRFKDQNKARFANHNRKAKAASKHEI